MIDYTTRNQRMQRDNHLYLLLPGIFLVGYIITRLILT